MNIDFYRNFIKIVDCGTLLEASRQLHIAQSALSTQIKLFEEDYGAKLFIRNPRSMELTAEGELVYNAALNIITLIDNTHTHVKSNVMGSKGTLKIAVSHNFLDNDKEMSVLKKYHDLNPGINFDIYETTSSRVLELLETGIVEIGIVRMSGMIPPQFEKRVTFPQKMFVYARPDNPWISMEDEIIKITELDKVPIAFPRSYKDVLTDAFERTGVNPIFFSVSSTRLSVLRWANENASLALLNSDIDGYTAQDPNLLCRPLEGECEEVNDELNFKLAILTRRGKLLSTIALKFFDTILD